MKLKLARASVASDVWGLRLRSNGGSFIGSVFRQLADATGGTVTRAILGRAMSATAKLAALPGSVIGAILHRAY